MTEPHAMKSASDRSDRSDPLGIVDLFRSERAVGHSDRSDHDKPAGPIGPNGATEARTAKSEANQRGPNGPAGPTRFEGKTGWGRPYPVDDFAHGFACDRFEDHPRTWTGRVVSLDQWRRMSEWERHGPNGRIFCGLCWGWHERGGCDAWIEAWRAVRER